MHRRITDTRFWNELLQRTEDLHANVSEKVQQKHHRNLQNLISQRTLVLNATTPSQGAYLSDPKRVALPSERPFEVHTSLCSKQLTQDQLSVLQKGLNFGVAPRRPDFRELLASFEKTARAMFFRQGPEVADQFRAAIDREISRDKRTPTQNLTPGEWRAVKQLQEDDAILILKADKGNMTVVMDKTTYGDKAAELLDDNATYDRVSPLDSLPVFGAEKNPNLLKNGEARAIPLDGLDWKAQKESTALNDLLVSLV